MLLLGSASRRRSPRVSNLKTSILSLGTLKGLKAGRHLCEIHTVDAIGFWRLHVWSASVRLAVMCVQLHTGAFTSCFCHNQAALDVT